MGRHSRTLGESKCTMCLTGWQEPLEISRIEAWGREQEEWRGQGSWGPGASREVPSTGSENSEGQNDPKWVTDARAGGTRGEPVEGPEPRLLNLTPS